MIILATNQVYRISNKVEVTGDKETTKKLSAVENMADQTKKKMEALSKINVSPSVHLNDQASSKLDVLQSKINKVKNLNVDVNVKAKDESSGTLGKVGEKVKGLVKTGTQKVISLGVSGVEASIKNYAEYEQVLSNIKATSKSTDTEMKTLDTTAKKLGSSSKWSATSVAEAEKTLVQSGMSVSDTVSALPGILDLATAGGIDLAAAADIASGTLTGFNLKGSDSAKVADILASSASETKSDLGELGDTMKYMSPVSSSLGISLEDTAVAAGLLGGQNIKGAAAATMLKQTIGKLASPTKEAAEMMKRYNINAYDSQGKMKPLSGIVDNLNSSLANLPDQEKEGAIATIFGTDNMSGIFALMNQGGKSFGELSQKVQNAKGLTKEMADIKMDTLAGQWDRLKAAASTMSVSLGEKLAPYARQFIDWLIEKMPVIEDKILGIVDFVSKNIDVIGVLTGTVLGLGVAFSGLSAIGNLCNALKGITSLVGLFKGASVAAEATAMAEGLGEVGAVGATGGIGALVGSFGALLPIIAPIAAGVGILGLIIAGCEAHSEIMNKTVDTSTEELTGFQRIINSLTGNTIKSREELESAGLVYKKFGDNIGEDFQNKVEESTKAIGEFSLFISNINFDHVLSESETAEFNKRVDNLATSAIETIKNRQKETQTEMTKLFMSDDNYLDDTEKSVLQALSGQGQEQIDKVTSDQKIIHDIYNNAIKTRGYLTDDEKKSIKDRYIEISQLELEAATETKTKEERSYLKHDFENRANNLSAKDASELLENQDSKFKEQKIKDLNTYDVGIDRLKELKQNQEGSQKDNTQKEIDKLTTERNEVDQYYENQRNEAFKTIETQNPDLKGKLNRYTFDVLGENDEHSQNILEDLKKNYIGLKDIKESGKYSLERSNGMGFADVYVDVDKTHGEIVGAFAKDYEGENLGGYSEKIAGETFDSASHKELANYTAILSTPNTQMISNITDTGAIPPNTDTKINGDKTDTIPPNTDAKINGNIPETKAETKELLSNLSSIVASPWRASIIIAKKIMSLFDGDLGSTDGATEAGSSNDLGESSVPDTESNNTEKAVESNILGIFSPFSRFGWIKPNYIGTTNGTRGINSVAERGFEIVMGRQLRWFNGGEKVLTHSQSKAFLENQQSSEPFQVKQGQYQVIQPQMQVAGAGNVSVGDIQVSVNGNHDANGIVQEVVQVVGYKLKEALTNIKK